jgi:peroxiredoxin
MKKSINFIIPIFFLLFSCDNGTAQAKTKNNLAGKRDNAKKTVLAPDFTLANLEGQSISLNDLKGKVVLLNFWGTWCGPCKREIPDFISLSNKHKKDGLEIIGVTLSSGSPEKIQAFSEKWAINYTLLTDIKGNETQSVTARYGQVTGQPITGIPTTFIIDREGYIRQRYVGPRSEEVFFKDLEPYL